MTGDGDIDINVSSFVINLQLLPDQFENRFQQFNTIEPMVTFFINPFTCQLKVTVIAIYIAELIEVRRVELELKFWTLRTTSS